MTAALILLCAIVGVGALLYLHHRLTGGSAFQEAPSARQAASDDGGSSDEGCCGLHITCEKDSLLSSVSSGIEYFEDEELDRFRGRGEDSYSDAEEEEFRDVLLSMPADNIAPWARSLQLRGITMPSGIRDELLLIVSEARAARTTLP